MTIYMLDTNICIYIMKKQPAQVAKKFSRFHIGDIVLSSVSLSELTYGVHKSHHVENNMLHLKEFISPLKILSYDDHAAFEYGKIRAELEKKGLPIGSLDALIAAHAVSVNAILVTNNIKEFSRIKQLKCENWVL